MNVTQPFPCLPGYDGPNEGVIAFVHHDVLAEYSLDIMERVRFYNNGGKPAHELETRRRCMVYLDPTNQPWAEHGRQQDELERQWVELGRQRAKHKRQEDELKLQRAEHRRQGVELGRQRAELWRQEVELEPAILAQIKALVPDLPWDGHKLVFQKETP